VGDFLYSRAQPPKPPASLLLGFGCPPNLNIPQDGAIANILLRKDWGIEEVEIILLKQSGPRPSKILRKAECPDCRRLGVPPLWKCNNTILVDAPVL